MHTVPEERMVEVIPMSWDADIPCARCDPLRYSSLISKVPAADAPTLRPDRIALRCVSCGALFVRPDGSL